MAVVVGVLLAVVALGVVLFPFLRRRFQMGGHRLTDALEEVRARREAIYSEIASLELEHELGQVEQEEYQHRFDTYRLEAAVALQEQEGLEADLQALDDALETDVQRIRLGQDGNAASLCPKCGGELDPVTHACPQCGDAQEADRPTRSEGRGA